MKKIYKYIIFLIFFFSWVYYMISQGRQVTCDLYKQHKIASFEGIVVEKFIDEKEHSFPFIYISNYKDNHLEKLNLFYDTNAYKVIRLKDTIVKIKNDPWLYKKDKKSLIKLTVVTYGCKNF